MNFYYIFLFEFRDLCFICSLQRQPPAASPNPNDPANGTPATPGQPGTPNGNDTPQENGQDKEDQT